jgi:transcriptional regulator of arginine metabolism
MRNLLVPQSKSARHEAIRRLLGAERIFARDGRTQKAGAYIGTQEDLCRALAREGFRVTQATLSRDLQQLGAVRVSAPEGTIYELPAAPGKGSARLPELSDLVASVAENDSLVVVRTRAGAASAVALAIDTARLPECLGTLAGDDTIFATPVRGVPVRKLSRKLRNLFGREMS